MERLDELLMKYSGLLDIMLSGRVHQSNGVVVGYGGNRLLAQWQFGKLIAVIIS